MGQNLQDAENLQYSSFFFLKVKSVRAAKWRYQTLVMCRLSQMDGGFELLKKKIQKKYYDGFFERFFHYIEKHVNLSIENLPLYDTYEFLLHMTKERMVWTF